MKWSDSGLYALFGDRQPLWQESAMRISEKRDFQSKGTSSKTLKWEAACMLEEQKRGPVRLKFSELSGKWIWNGSQRPDYGV